jgi:septal ring factor EnvC (AmiA/AmiB activator)
MTSDASDEEKLEKITALETQLNQTIADLTAVSSELEAQRAALTEAQNALTAKQAELDAANVAIEELTVQIEEMNAQTESDIAARAELETQLAAIQEQSVAITGELDSARAEYEKRVAELEAYLLSRELIAGEAYSATAASNAISVASDGVTAACNYTNTTVSGNPVELSIVSGDKELYRSEILAPGESVTEFKLSEALPAGAHDVMLVTTVYDADGSVQLVSRVPVTLNVAE